MNLKKAISLSLVLLCFCIDNQLVAQEKVDSKNGLNIGIQFGYPILAGANFEYIFPSFNNRFGLDVDLSRIKNMIPSSEQKIGYWAIGANYYFLGNGSGPYLGFDYGEQSFNISEIASDPVDLDIDFGYFNSKLGYKTKKKLYWKIELGYSLITFDLTKANEFLNKTYSIEIQPKLNFFTTS